MAATWPSLAACQENAPAGPIPIPDHPLVRQTVDDVLFEPLDVVGLEALLARIARGRGRGRAAWSPPEPSVLAHGILNGAPCTFLDDAPLEERRSRAVELRRGLGPIGADGLPDGTLAADPLDDAVVAEVVALGRAARAQRRRAARAARRARRACDPSTRWQRFADELAARGPPRRPSTARGSPPSAARRPTAISLDDDGGRGLHPRAPPARRPRHRRGPRRRRRARRGSAARRAAVACRARARRWPRSRRRATRSRCPTVGGARGTCSCGATASPGSGAAGASSPSGSPTTSTSSASGSASSPSSRFEGRAGVLAAIEQLQGIELPAGDWEAHVLPARVAHYDPTWLDELCLSGEVAWARLTPRPERRPRAARLGDAVGRHAARARAAATTSRGCSARCGSARSPAAAAPRRVARPARGARAPRRPVPRRARHVVGAAARRGRRGAVGPRRARHRDRRRVLGGPLAARRARAVPRAAATPRRPRASRARRDARTPAPGVGEGRWSVVASPPGAPEGIELEELAERVAVQLLVRWGVVAYELTSRESVRVPWRHVVWALRRLEARGEVVGGRFVVGVSGEQYATQDAAELLAARREGRAGDARHAVGLGPDQPHRHRAARPARARGSAPPRARRRRATCPTRRADGRVATRDDRATGVIAGTSELVAASWRAARSWGRAPRGRCSSRRGPQLHEFLWRILH